MKLVVNLPAWNEEEKIAATIKRVPRQIAGVDEVFVQVTGDGCTDQTIAHSREAGANSVYDRGVHRGIGVTFRDSVEQALQNGADIMVNIDADGQFNPNDIAELIQPVLKGEADIVSADRFGEKAPKDMPKIKHRLNRVAAWIIGKFMGSKINDLTCGFRAYSREALLRLNLPGGFTYTQEVIIDALGKNLIIKWIPVEVTYFADRKSRVVKSVFNYVNNSFKIILKAVRDVRPMKFFGIPGVIMISFALGVFIYFLFLYLPEFKITQYRNYLILALTLFFIGLQFLVFALIADMIKTSRKMTEDQLYLLRKEKYKK
ncbi:glycosyltransferase family 2 protein [Patescibacteria group bacterium]|nr:MAG: glycosyltransferase family 2 protein [Patescibacteria group bacterium]